MQAVMSPATALASAVTVTRWLQIDYLSARPCSTRAPKPRNSNTALHTLCLQCVDTPYKDDSGLSEPFWLPCQHKGKEQGRLLVQVQFIRHIHVRPLKVLVVTWNMGNAAPNASFSGCFPDSETYVLPARLRCRAALLSRTQAA
jgi:hypothetical protein